MRVCEKADSANMKTKNAHGLSRTQLAAFRHFIGLPCEALQSNHRINGIRSCRDKGLIETRRVSQFEATSHLTEAGEALANELRQAIP